jgi:hypothetical protein
LATSDDPVERAQDGAGLDAFARVLGLTSLSDGSEASHRASDDENIFARPDRGPRLVRPALTAQKAAAPVIVRIPSRPKADAKDLYLAALDALGEGDRTVAIDQLRLAVRLDDETPLYRELLAQLET